MNKTELKTILKRLPRLFFGLFLCALGITTMLNADIGLSPWDIFHKGLSIQTGLTFGQAQQLTGLSVIIIGMLLGIFPGLATILNMIFVGEFVDLIIRSGLFSTPENTVIKVIMLYIGITILCSGIYFYLSSNLGAGPRDGLMLGLVQKLNKKVAVIKTFIEVSVLIIGYLLGGPLGIGTVLLAFSTGPILQTIFKIGKFDANKNKQLNLKDQFYILFPEKKPEKNE